MAATPTYLFGKETPPPATLKKVVDGVHWLRFPLPFKLDHINLWLLEDGDGWTLVDTGMGNEQTQAIWEEILETQLGGRPLNQIIVTHFHPDHMGNAGWLSRKLSIPVYCAQGEWTQAKLLFAESDEDMAVVQRRFYTAAGMEEAFLDSVTERPNRYKPRITAPPATYRRLFSGDTIEIDGKAWRIIVGYGHAPEHLCLYREEDAVLISGDQILPRITTNVSIWPHEPESDPLALYLKSLDFFEPLAESTTVLPSHDWPFTGLHDRLEVLRHHHDERLEEVYAACAEPHTAKEVLKILFDRELDQHQTFFAIGESLAHLHYLEGLGRLDRSTDTNGVVRFFQA
ncbi:MAG: MBL fold metallo-hydrolase [Magnetospiraceae bacterium]